MGTFISQAIADQLRQFPGPNPPSQPTLELPSQQVQLPDRVVGMAPKRYDDPGMMLDPRSGMYRPFNQSDLYNFWVRQQFQGQKYPMDYRRMVMPPAERFGTAAHGPVYDPNFAMQQAPMPSPRLMDPEWFPPSLQDLLRVLMVR